jgi:hypothetical protein
MNMDHKVELANTVSLLKDANEIIAELQAENANLRKQAAAISESVASDATINKLLDKMASTTFNGRPLIPSSEKNRLAVGLRKHSNAINILSEMVDRYERVSKEASTKADDAHSVGTESAVKVASQENSFVERLAAGRIRM